MIIVHIFESVKDAGSVSPPHAPASQETLAGSDFWKNPPDVLPAGSRGDRSSGWNAGIIVPRINTP